MAGSATAIDGGYTALYANPAGMLHTRSTAGLAFSATFDNARIALSDRPEGYDVPDLGPNSPAIPTVYRLRERRDTQHVRQLWALTAGATSNLGFEWLRVGALASLPIDSAGTQATFFHDEREQFFSNRLRFDLLGTRNEHQVILVGAAARIADWLAIGASMSFMPRVTGTNRVYMDSVADQEDVDLAMNVTQAARWRAIVGVVVTPVPAVRLGATFRDAQYLSLKTVNEVQARGLHDGADFPILQELDVVTNYSPRQVSFGAAWDSPVALWSFDWAYTLWSDYPGDDGGDSGFDDTVSVRAGVESPLVEHHVVRAGFAWEPTPVPAQRGRTNYVDNDRVVGSIGTGHDIEVGESVLHVDWHFQLHGLLTRTERKTRLDVHPPCTDAHVVCDEIPDETINPATGEPWTEARGLQTGNPGFPGWSSGGWLGSVGVEARWEF